MRIAARPSARLYHPGARLQEEEKEVKEDEVEAEIGRARVMSNPSTRPHTCRTLSGPAILSTNRSGIAADPGSLE